MYAYIRTKTAVYDRVIVMRATSEYIHIAFPRGVEKSPETVLMRDVVEARYYTN